jgi:hypothetical protein
MIVHTKYFLNDSFSTSDAIPSLTNKFQYLFNLVNNTSSYLDLELWYLRINRRVIKLSEYKTIAGSTRSVPLTSIRVGFGGEPTTVSPSGILTGNPTVNSGYNNYTNFINRIFNRHGIRSRFYPMGFNYILPVGGLNYINENNNIVGCHLSVLEDFALTFVEKPVNINDGVNIPYTTNTIFHIETAAPMTLKGLAAEYNPYFEFNTVVSLYGFPQRLIDATSFLTDNRYTPAI